MQLSTLLLLVTSVVEESTESLLMLLKATQSLKICTYPQKGALVCNSVYITPTPFVAHGHVKPHMHNNMEVLVYRSFTCPGRDLQRFCLSKTLQMGFSSHSSTNYSDAEESFINTFCTSNVLFGVYIYLF